MFKQWLREVLSSIESALREARRPAARQQRRTLLRLQQLEERDCPSSMTWIGSDGGNWNTGSNWTGGVAPGPLDDAVFDGAYSQGSCVYNQPQYSRVANSITLKANYEGELHLAQSGPANIGPGGIELDGGGIEQDQGAPIYDAGDFTWTGGDLNDFTGLLSSLNMAAGTNVSISQTTSKNTGDDINLTGATGVISMPNMTAKLTFDKNAGINIDSTSTLNLVDCTLVTGGTGVVTNNGTLLKTTGTIFSSTELPIVNNGLFQLQDASATFSVTGKDANGYSFDQQGAGATCDLWNKTTLSVPNGFYMTTGNLWTEGGGLGSTINGNATVLGGLISLNHNNPASTGLLDCVGQFTLSGSAEFDVKVDCSRPGICDQIDAKTFTLGGTFSSCTLKAISINIPAGGVPRGNSWAFLSCTVSGGISGNFNNFDLGFGDGTGGSYGLSMSTTEYFLNS